MCLYEIAESASIHHPNGSSRQVVAGAWRACGVRNEFHLTASSVSWSTKLTEILQQKP